MSAIISLRPTYTIAVIRSDLLLQIAGHRWLSLLDYVAHLVAARTQSQ